MRRILLDANATTRPLPEVIEAMNRCWRDAWANPGSRHAEGRAARRALEKSRETIAGILGAHPDEVIFTSGGTESINLAIRGLLPNVVNVADSAFCVATPPGEHPATRETVLVLKAFGIQQETLPLNTNGLLHDAELPQLCWPHVRLVSLLLAHNETGVIQNIEPLARICEEHRIPWHLDAVQAVGKIPVDFHKLGATALSLGAHKFHGPRGIGALLLRKGVTIRPFLRGGHQEAERRAGTEPVPLIVGMATALELWHRHRDSRTAHVTMLRDRLQRGLVAQCAPAIVHGESAERLPNTLSIAFPGMDGEALLVALDLEGIACSLGSTCASGAAEPAPILTAMGCSREVAMSSVRFSLSFEQSEEEIDEAIDRIARIVHRLRPA